MTTQNSMTISPGHAVIISHSPAISLPYLETSPKSASNTWPPQHLKQYLSYSFMAVGLVLLLYVGGKAFLGINDPQYVEGKPRQNPAHQSVPGAATTPHSLLKAGSSIIPAASLSLPVDEAEIKSETAPGASDESRLEQKLDPKTDKHTSKTYIDPVKSLFSKSSNQTTNHKEHPR